MILVGEIEAEGVKFRQRGAFRPRVLAGDAEHRRYRVIAERHNRTQMLLARAGDIHPAMDDDVLESVVRHAYLGILN